MKLLGIRYGHDAASALIIDGEIIADVAEERFTRIKNDTSFPINAINYCLKAGGIESIDLDGITIPSIYIPDAFFVFFAFPELIEHETYKTVYAQKKYIIEKTNLQIKRREPPYPDFVPVLPIYQKQFTLSKKCKIYSVEHHLGHAAAAAYTSGVNDEKSLIITMDGIGDGTSTAIFRFIKNRIEIIEKFDGTSSLGWFYAAATEAMDWRQSSDEWKLMGLAPYGTPKPGSLKGFHPVFKDGYLIKPHNFGDFGRWNDHGANHYHCNDAPKLSKLVQKLGRKNFAAEVQRVAEEQAFNIILPWLMTENTRNIFCAGGFFLNVKFNQKLWYSGKLDNQWIYPNAGDAGLPVGTALFIYYSNNPDKKHSKLEKLYYGPDFTNEEIKKILDERGLLYQYADNSYEIAAKYLTKNYVIGWFQGRMETGPRALGNRSILMSPLKSENKDIINEKVKYRETFRPFTPSMLYEKMEDYLINPREELFMTTSFDVKEEKKKCIPAVVHVDGTARPQMVKKETNSVYYNLIKKFGELTGEYVILNTSFNVKGEPIICNPREAIKCFYDTGIDILVLGNYIIEKPYLKKF